MKQDELRAELTYWKETAEYWKQTSYKLLKELNKTLDKENAK